MISKKDRAIACLSYFSWLTLLIAYLLGRNQNSEFIGHHIGQSMILQIFASIVMILSRLPKLPTVLFDLCSFVVLAYLIWGIINSIRGSMQDIPLLSMYKNIRKK